MFCPSGRNKWSFPATWCDLLHAANKKKQINNHRPGKTDTFPFRHNILRFSIKIVSKWKFCPSRWQNLPSPLNVYLVYNKYMNRYRKTNLGFSEIGRHMHGCSCRWCFIGFVTFFAPATTTTPHTSFDLLHVCRPRNLQSFRVSSGQIRTNGASNQNSSNMREHWERAAEHPKTSSKPRTLICYMSSRTLAILLFQTE
jgi:hypothetical protein